MPSRTIKLVLAYDGTDFAGWQRQAEDRSVQGALEDSLARMHGHNVAVSGAGRTDSGVHAAGQVAHFHTDIASIRADRFVPALNKLLPRDVRVLSSAEADPDFHARYDARERRYKYFMYVSDRPLPWRDRYAWRLHGNPDMLALNRMAACLRGETDFTAFASAKDPSANRSRYVRGATFYREGDALVFDICANAFLWRMVRSLVGSLVEYEREGRPAHYMAEVLASGDRGLAGTTAPARGLFLWNVEYYDVPTRRGRRPEPEANAGTGIREGRRLVPGLGLVDD